MRYPKEEARVKIITRAEIHQRNTVVYRKEFNADIETEKFNPSAEFFKNRWRITNINDYQYIMEFLKVPRQFGTIFIRRNYPLYGQTFHQTCLLYTSPSPRDRG